MKRHNSGILPAALAAHLGRFPRSLSCFVFFFPPVCRKRTASVYKCCYETRPHKCPSFSNPGNYLPTDILPDYTWSRFCSATVRHRPDPSFTLCELYPPCMHTKKKRFSPNTRFHQVKKAPARFAFFKVSDLIFFVLFNWFFLAACSHALKHVTAVKCWEGLWLLIVR